MRKEDGKVKFIFCNNASCSLYQKEQSVAIATIIGKGGGQFNYCPACGSKLEVRGADA